MRILVVESDPVMQESIAAMLNAENITVEITALGEEAISLAKNYDFDVISAAIKLPDITGYEVIKTLRTEKIKTPIIIVSGLGGVQDIVKALNLGADDYLVKPFHKDEYVARLHALTRRVDGRAEQTLPCGPLTLKPDEGRVYFGEHWVRMSVSEYKVLHLLATRRDSVVTPTMFLDHLYGGLDEPEIKIIDVFICKIRKKLRLLGVPNMIETVWGRGFIIRDGVTEEVPLQRKTQSIEITTSAA